MIGLDLDGTIISYDAIFRRLASTRLGLPPLVAGGKEPVRDWVRAQPNGEQHWIELQAIAYGRLIDEAEPSPGVLDFLHVCRTEGIEVVVVSHRTPVAVADPEIDLHAAAFRWLERHGISRDHVRLEATRREKIARIAAARLTLFVDDLAELFADPAFPTSTERWLYSPGAPDQMVNGVHVFSEWDTVLHRARELEAVPGAR